MKKINIPVIILSLFLVLFTMSILLLTLRGIPGNIKESDFKNNLDQTTKPFELSPERGRFLLTMSLGDDHSFSLSKELGNAAFPDVGYYNGKLFIFFAPGISVMALPFYLIGKQYNLAQIATFSMISVFTVFNFILLFLISKRIFQLPRWVPYVVSFIFVFGTTAWSYSNTLYQHQVTTFFILAAFYMVWKYRQKTKFSWLYSALTWFCFGVAIAIDYPNAFLMLPVMVYLAISAFEVEKLKNSFRLNIRLSAILTSVLFVALIGLQGYYNYINYGDWKKLSGGLTSLKKIQEKHLLIISGGEEEIKQISEEKSIVSFFAEEHLPTSNATLLFSVDRGLFFYMPIFALALFGIWNIRKRINTELSILLALIAVNLFLYSSWGDPWGGWAFGPRYLIPTMAYLSIFVGIWLSQKYNFLKGVLTYILFAFSSAIALLGALTTNAVPPKVEADFLHTSYNFFHNLEYFREGRSSSFIYNTYLSKTLSLTDYYMYIYAAVLAVFFCLLFIPLFFKRHESND